MNKILLTFATLFFLAACTKDKTAPMQPVAITVKLAFATDQGSVNIPFKHAQIIISNAVTGNKYTDSITAENTNQVTFPSLVPGSYNVAVTLNLTAAEYLAATGIKTDGNVLFSGTLQMQSATAPQNDFTVQLQTGSGSEDWVIKQLYYAGSDTKDGAIFRDQFIELYNNSDRVLYADSLYMAQVEGVSTAMEKIDLSKGWYLPATGQWDWSKSIGNSGNNLNTDYMYISALFRIPGTGKNYPVQPGKSIVIAATAINHKSPYKDVNGKDITVRNPDLTVDLSQAEFDVYMGNFPGTSPLASDLNTNAPHLDVIINPNRELVFDNLGREGVMIFRSGVNPTSWQGFKTPENNKNGKLNLRAPKADMQVLDVIELQPSLVASRTPKRMPLNWDAMYAYVKNGSYSSEALLRKTQKVVNGRVVLQDTNNSSLDFVTIKADPSKNAFTAK